MSNAKVDGIRQSGHGGSAFMDLATDCAIALVAILPLLITRHLPLTDLPNHLARQYILRDLAGSPILQHFYEVHWALVPNLALDIFVAGARTLMSIDLAVRLFCIVTILMLFFGTRLINLALGGARSRIYRIAPLLCYGGPFQFGFLNYCFGIGLALVLSGSYLRLRKRSSLRLFLIFAPLSFVLLVCHLASFGLFAIAIGGFELAQAYADEGGWSRRFIIRTLAQAVRIAIFLAPSLALYWVFNPMPAALGVHYSGLWGKLDSVAAIVLFSSPATELPLLVFAGIGLLAALFAGVVRIHHGAFVMAGLFAILWLITPSAALGTQYAAYRLPWGMSFFLLAGLIPGPGTRHAGAFGAAFGALVLIRIGLIAAFWISWEPTEAAIDDALGRLPLGARLLPVRGDIGSISRSRRPPLDHVAGYATARRQAFEPNIFADIAGQILHLRQPYKDMRTERPEPQLRQLAPEYNYVLVLNPEHAWISPRLPLACVEQGPSFRLLKVVDHPPSAPARRSGEYGRADFGDPFK